MHDELIELVGKKPYDLLVAHLRARAATGTTWLAHPALKKQRAQPIKA
jgi:hypothetical protein